MFEDTNRVLSKEVEKETPIDGAQDKAEHRNPANLTKLNQQIP
jgi:hypothetical protein